MSSSNVNINEQYPLKLLGIDNIVCSNEDVLEFLGLYVLPASIIYLHFDSFQKFYVVFLSDIESVCKLIGKRLVYSGCKIDILPLLDYYIIKNVYPNLAKEDVVDLFRPFGNVYDVKDHHVLPNSSRFSHVLSGNREISFLLPGWEQRISVPGSVVCLPHAFHVVKYCPACSTEGHEMLKCPDIDDNCFFEDVPSRTADTENDLDFENIDNDDLICNDDKFHTETPSMKCLGRGKRKSDEFSDKAHPMEQETIKTKTNKSGKRGDEQLLTCGKVSNSEAIICEKEEIFKTKRKYLRKKFIKGNYSTRRNNCCFNTSKVSNSEAIICEKEEIFKRKRKYLRKKFIKGNYSTRRNTKQTGHCSNNDKNSDPLNGDELNCDKVADMETVSCENEKTIERKRKYVQRKILLNHNNAKWEIVSEKTKTCSNNGAVKDDGLKILLDPTLEKVVQNSQGILPVHVLKRLLIMDLRNKKDIIAYISKFTFHFDEVFYQFKILQSQFRESNNFYTTKYLHYYNKIFSVMKTLLRKSPNIKNET